MIGGVIGVCSALGPMYETQPLLFFIPLAWCMYVFGRIYSFNRAPRKNDWAFIVGLSYEKRHTLSLGFLGRKSIELGMVCAVAAPAFLAIRAILFRTFAWAETAESTAIMFGEIVILYGTLFLIFKLSFVRPMKNDVGMIRRLISIGTSRLQRNHVATPRRFSFSLPLLSYDQNIFLRRQLLYLYRVSFFDTLFFILCGAVAYCLAFLFASSHQVLFLSLFSSVPPFIILFKLTSVMSESAQNLDRCPFYSFPRSSVFIVNSVFASAVVVPFQTALFCKVIFFTHSISLLTVMYLASASVSSVSILLVFAFRFGLKTWNGTIVAAVGIVMVCCVLGSAIPYAGILFPMFAAIFVVVVLHEGKSILSI